MDLRQLAGSSGQIRLWSMNCNAEAVMEMPVQSISRTADFWGLEAPV
jgi:hypothetical protein